MADAVDELADRMGIAGEFQDAHGELVRTTRQTRLNLLAAMGGEATQEGAAQAALTALEEVEW